MIVESLGVGSAGLVGLRGKGRIPGIEISSSMWQRLILSRGED